MVSREGVRIPREIVPYVTFCRIDGKTVPCYKRFMFIDRSSLIFIAALGWALAGLQSLPASVYNTYINSQGVTHGQQRIQAPIEHSQAWNPHSVLQRIAYVQPKIQQTSRQVSRDSVARSRYAVEPHRKAHSTKRSHRTVGKHRHASVPTVAKTFKRAHILVGVHRHHTVKVKVKVKGKRYGHHGQHHNPAKYMGGYHGGGFHNGHYNHFPSSSSHHNVPGGSLK